MRWGAIVIACASACSFHEAATDGGAGDGAPHADAPHATIMLAASAHADMAATAAQSFSVAMTIPAGAHQLLLAYVGIGSHQGDSGVATINSVTCGATPLVRLAAIVGTPINSNATRSELWELPNPPPGATTIAVSTSAGWWSLHLGALVFTGVNATTPVRTTAMAQGSGASSSVTMTSAAGDLVVDVIGQGNQISAPGSGQSSSYVDNVGTTTTLDNTAAGTSPGSASPRALTWTFATSDQWQALAASLVPAAP